MAIDTPITDLAVTQRERTWRINVETPGKAETHSIQVYRETQRLDEAGNVLSSVPSLTPTHRMLETVKEETVTVGGAQFKAEDVFEALSEFSDRWAEEDEEAEEEDAA